MTRIVQADASQLDALAALEETCFPVPLTKAQLTSLLPGNMHEMFAALDEEGKLCGYCSMMYVLDEGYIGNVAVSPLHRREGVATALLQRLADRGAELDLSFLTLEVRESNAAAIGLYGKNGYRKAGLRKNYYQHPAEHAILMTKYLK